MSEFAFPRPVSEDRTGGDRPDGNDTVPAQNGMTLLDWFAGQALTGILSNPGTSLAPPALAVVAYQVAAAMVAESQHLASGADVMPELPTCGANGCDGRAAWGDPCNKCGQVILPF